MIRNGIVIILDDRDVPVGVGCLFASNRVLTTKSVVDLASDSTLELTNRSVKVVFPFLKRNPVTSASVEDFPSSGSYPNSEIADLKLKNPLPPGCQPANFVRSDDYYQHQFVMDGFDPNPTSAYQISSVRGRLLGIDAPGWIRYRRDDQPFNDRLGYPKWPGFLGSPVWDYDLNGFIGIVGDLAWSDPIRPIFAAADRRPILKEGLIISTEILKSVMQTFPDTPVMNDKVSYPNRVRVELIIDPASIKLLSGEKDSLELLIEGLSGVLSLEKDDIHICSALTTDKTYSEPPDRLFILLDLPARAAVKLVDLITNNDQVAAKFGIRGAQNLENATRVSCNVGPKREPPIPGKEIAHKPYGKQAETVQSLQELYDEKIKRMADLKESFLKLAITSIQSRYWEFTREITASEYANTKRLDQTRLNQLNLKIQYYTNQAPNEVGRRLDRQPNLWWHEVPRDQQYILYDNTGQRAPAGEIEKIIRDLANVIIPILKGYGYDCSKGLSTNPYEWTVRMKTAYADYEDLRKETKPIYHNLETMKQLSEQTQGINTAKDRWSKTL
jgi:hypothetical protein